MTTETMTTGKMKMFVATMERKISRDGKSIFEYEISFKAYDFNDAAKYATNRARVETLRMNLQKNAIELIALRMERE